MLMQSENQPLFDLNSTNDSAMKKKGVRVVSLLMVFLALTSFFAGRYSTPIASSEASVAVVTSESQAFTRGAVLSGDPNEEWIEEQIKEGNLTFEPVQGEGEDGKQIIIGCVIGGIGFTLACGTKSGCVRACAAQGFPASCTALCNVSGVCEVAVKAAIIACAIPI